MNNELHKGHFNEAGYDLRLWSVTMTCRRSQLYTAKSLDIASSVTAKGRKAIFRTHDDS